MLERKDSTLAHEKLAKKVEEPKHQKNTKRKDTHGSQSHHRQDFCRQPRHSIWRLCARSVAQPFFTGNRSFGRCQLESPALFGRAEKVRFRARWAALLQGIGLWAALVVIPELKADPKLSRKITSQMEAYTDALLKAPILDHLSPDEIRDYTLLRQRFMRLGAAASTVPDKDAFARAFLSALTGKAPNEAAPARVSAMALHVGLAYGLFAKLAEISRSEPLSYQRVPKKR